MKVMVVMEGPLHPQMATQTGFAMRYLELVHHLGESHTVDVIQLDRGVHASAWFASGDEAGARTHTLAVDPIATSRVGRVSRLVTGATGVARMRGWERALRRRVVAAEPDVLIVLAWAYRFLYRSIVGIVPTVAFVEEDLGVHEPGSRSPFGRVLLAAEQAAEHRSIGRSAAVAVIAERERPWATEAFSMAPGRTHLVPHFIDEDHWRRTGDTTPSDSFFVIGQMSHPRNADGLVQIVRAVRRLELDPSPRFVVAGDADRSLLDIAGDDVELIGRIEDPRPEYEVAMAALVPAFVASGAKTTILQAWAMGTPVVTTDASARGVAAQHDRDVVCGPDAEAVAHEIARVRSDPELRRRLAAGGLASFRARHSRPRFHEAVDELLAVVGGTVRHRSRASSEEAP